MKFILPILFALSLPTNAAIIGMLTVDGDLAVRVAAADPATNRLFIEISGDWDRKEIFFSRYIGGEGGNADTSHVEISNWMAPSRRPVLRIGIYSSVSEFRFRSQLTGKDVVVPFIAGARVSLAHRPAGRFKNVYALNFGEIATPEEVAAIREGRMAVEIMVQRLVPFDADLAIAARYQPGACENLLHP